MVNILGITQGAWSNLQLALAAVIPTLALWLINHLMSKKSKIKEKQQTEIPSWSKDIAVNKDILKRLAAIKVKLGAERVCLFVNHNGVADASGNHLKRFSLHSVVKDSNMQFDTQKYINVNCSIYNEFFEVLLSKGKIEIRDTEKGTHHLSRVYYEQGMISLYAYPVIFENIFYGFVTASNWDNKPNISIVDHDSIYANIQLIITAIKTLKDEKK